jgi:hypothetical protein
MAELKKVGGDDADLLLAKDAEPVLRQVLAVSPGVQESVKTINQETSSTVIGSIHGQKLSLHFRRRPFRVAA